MPKVTFDTNIFLSRPKVGLRSVNFELADSTVGDKFSDVLKLALANNAVRGLLFGKSLF